MSEAGGLRAPGTYGWVIVGLAFVTMGVAVNTRTAFSLLFPPILDELGIALPPALRALMDGTSYALTPEVTGRAAELVPDELIDVCSIAGTPDECLERFRRLAARGFDHVAVWPFAPEGRPIASVIDLLVEEVAPGLTGAATTPLGG